MRTNGRSRQKIVASFLLGHLSRGGTRLDCQVVHNGFTEQNGLIRGLSVSHKEWSEQKRCRAYWLHTLLHFQTKLSQKLVKQYLVFQGVIKVHERHVFTSLGIVKALSSTTQQP